MAMQPEQADREHDKFFQDSAGNTAVRQGPTYFVSTNNSTTTTLAGDGVFTGTSDEMAPFASVSVNWFSDVASADNGCSLQFSSDGTNWDLRVFSTSFTDGSNHRGIHRLSVAARYFRLVYTNGSTIQATFRLQVIMHSTNSMPLISRLDSQLGLSTDVLITRAITNIDLDLARKHITGQRSFFFFGFNEAVGTSYEDIHPAGGNINWQTTAVTVSISSSHAADTAAGLGCRSVEIHGLSATGADQDEVVVLSGTTEVDTALTYIRVNKMHSETVGTYGGSHQGDITARVDSGGMGNGAILSQMTGEEGAADSSVQYGSGEAGNGYWSVPLGKVAYITRLEVEPDVGTNKTVDVILYEREGILNTSGSMDPRRILWDAIGIDKIIEKEFKSHLKIKQLTDIFFRAQGSATSKISVSLDFYLLDQDADGA